MKILLNSYYPLIHTKFGREASSTFGIHPLEDGSIRREPDFAHQLPSISGLCRPGTMKGLDIGDLIIYKTNITHFLTAILEVKEKFDSHEDAFNWLNAHKLNIPSNNVFVPPLPLNKSHRLNYIDRIGKSEKLDKVIHANWNGDYIARANNPRSSYFFLTNSIYNAVQSDLAEDNFVRIDGLLRSHFGVVPNTSWRPQELTAKFYTELAKMLKL